MTQKEVIEMMKETSKFLCISMEGAWEKLPDDVKAKYPLEKLMQEAAREAGQ